MELFVLNCAWTRTRTRTRSRNRTSQTSREAEQTDTEQNQKKRLKINPRQAEQVTTNNSNRSNYESMTHNILSAYITDVYLLTLAT